MKICLSCGSRFGNPEWRCPSCHTAPKLLEGVPSFAPDLAEENTGFEATHFCELVRVEAKNFWFRSRNRLIVWVLNRYFPTIESFFEIGCGTGYVLSGVGQAFPDLHLSGSEILSAGLNYAKSRVSGCDLFQMDARNIPFEEEFDVIGAFDVLEHIADDELVLSQAYRAIRPGGGIILTVPQHAILWSQSDEHACHVRRYSARDLKQKVQNAGFTLIRVTSFISLLLPLMFVSRVRQRIKKEHFDPMAELRITGLANQLLEITLGLERTLIRTGLSFPAGGSLLVVAGKVNTK